VELRAFCVNLHNGNQQDRERLSLLRNKKQYFVGLFLVVLISERLK